MKIFNFFKTRYIYIILLLLGFTPLVWFWKRNGFLIDGVDTNFPLDPWIWFLRRFYVWNNIANAGSDFSSSTAGLFFHLVQVIPYKMNFNLQLVEAFSILFWFSLLVFSAFTLARLIVPKKKIVQIFFVVFYCFNIYLFNSWENVKVTNLALVAALPLGLSLLILKRGDRLSDSRLFCYTVLVGLILSGTGINPAYFVTFFIATFIFSILAIIEAIKTNKLFRALKSYLIFNAGIILLNLFWLIPTINYIFTNISSNNSLSSIGFTNWVDSLSENTSILNIIRLQGAWDWYSTDPSTGQPLYIPYSTNFFHNPLFILFSFLIPLLSFFSLLIYDKSKKILYIFASLLLIIGIFMGVGTHDPTGIIFKFFVSHVPFLSLFRSPWYIFTPFVILAYAILTSLFLDNFYIFSKKIRASYLKIGITKVVSIFVALIILGNLIYSYPLVTGKIFRPNQQNGFYVRFPEYIFDSAKWLNSNNGGRVLSYPDDGIERFDWGYTGVESILELITNREVLFAPLNDSTSPVAKLLYEMYLAIHKGEGDKLNNLALKLDTNILFEKNDQSTLATAATNKINLPLIKNFGNWDFYQLGNENISKLFFAKDIYLGNPNSSEKLVSLIRNKEDIYINQSDNVNNLVKNNFSTGELILAGNSQVEDYFTYQNNRKPIINYSHDASRVVYRFSVSHDGIFKPVLENYGLESFGLSTDSGVSLFLDGKAAVWKISHKDDSFLYFESINLSKGDHTVEIEIKNENLVDNGNFNIDPAAKEEGQGSFEFINENGNRSLILNNTSTRNYYYLLNIPKFDYNFNYLLTAKFKEVYGNIPVISLRQGNNKYPLKVDEKGLPGYITWESASIYFSPVPTVSSLDVALLATPSKKEEYGTKVAYDDVSLFRVFDNNLFFISDSTPKLNIPVVSITRSTPATYEGIVRGNNRANVLVFDENYNPQWKITILDQNGKELPAVTTTHFTVNLYANAWYIDGAPENYRFKITYVPQIYFNISLFISAVTLFLALSFLLLNYVREKNS